MTAAVARPKLTLCPFPEAEPLKSARELPVILVAVTEMVPVLCARKLAVTPLLVPDNVTSTPQVTDPALAVMLPLMVIVSVPSVYVQLLKVTEVAVTVEQVAVLNWALRSEREK